MMEEHRETPTGTWSVCIAPVIVFFVRFRERNDIFSWLKWKIPKERGKELIAIFLLFFVVYRALPGVTAPFYLAGFF